LVAERGDEWGVGSWGLEWGEEWGELLGEGRGALMAWRSERWKEL
jgi:hypothetical protein